MEHRRHARKYRILSGLQQIQRLLRRESFHDVLARTDREHAEHGQIETIGVEQWQAATDDVLLVSSAIGAQQAAAIHNMPRIDSSTPFARPVVPDV